MREVLLVDANNSSAKLSALSKVGKLRRIHRGIYTENLQSPLEHIVQKNWMQLVTRVVPGGILAYRTAYDLRPMPYKNTMIVFVISSYVKTVILPGLIIKILPGNSTEFIEQVLPNLARSNTARMLLENLTQLKNSSYKQIKTCGKNGVEQYLAQELYMRHEERLNVLRDEALEVAATLNMQTEYKVFNKIVGALLSTNTDHNYLQTAYARAIAKKEPYDSERISSFEKLAIYLQKCDFKSRQYMYEKISFKNLTFFEAYFSNYIEGTEFEIDEAEEIVFAGRDIANRHADSHDVAATFNISGDYLEITRTPKTIAELLQILQARHAYLMQERPKIRPGMFKEKKNRAGNTYFVAPEDVIGTLTQGFELYKMLRPGMPRALFMHFLISEVHPFDDGNGRMARIMMNAELAQVQEFKIMLPNVLRDSYIGALRRASRDHYFNVYCKVMDISQSYTASIYWDEYISAREKIETDGADKHPDIGLTDFNKVIRKLDLSKLD